METQATSLNNLATCLSAGRFNNMTIEQLKTHKSILIVGYGLEGQMTEKFLKKYHPTAAISIVDQKDGEDYLSQQNEFDLAIKSPGVRKELIKIPYTTATNIFFANVSNTTIGITGSKGKSTTTKLVYEVLREAGYPARLYGNIGKPMLEYFLGEMDEKDILVLELSSYQLDDIEYSPHISCFLNIYHDHIDYHVNFEQYLGSKANIVKFSRPEDYFVYNGTFKEIVNLAQNTRAKMIDFAKQPFPTEYFQAANAIASLFDVSEEVFNDLVKHFSGLPHRLQTVGIFKDIIFIDDSAATTPEASIFALNTIRNVCSIILGGLDRQIDFTDLAKKVSEKNIHAIILFPNADIRLEKALMTQNIDPANIFHAKDMNGAVKLGFLHTIPGDVCLLSPGCASYNQYANFSQRGNLFKKLVHEYGKK